MNDNDIVLEGKIDVLPANISSKIAGKRIKKDKIEEFCRSVLSAITVSFLADGVGGTNDNHVKTAIMAIQMLWNEKEELKEKLVECQKRLESQHD